MLDTPMTDLRFSSDLTPNTLVPNTLALPTRTLEINDVLYEEGRDASSLYIVNSGVLKAIVPTSVGKERIADLLRPRRRDRHRRFGRRPARGDRRRCASRRFDARRSAASYE